MVNEAASLEESDVKYLCRVFYDEKVRTGLSEQESQALIQEAIQFDNGLRARTEAVDSYRQALGLARQEPARRFPERRLVELEKG
jgi:hypothetical protein